MKFHHKDKTTRLLTLHSFIRLDFNQTYKTIRILNNNTIVSFHHHTITRNNYNHIPPKFHTQFNCHHFHYYPFSEAILFILIQLLNSNCTWLTCHFSLSLSLSLYTHTHTQIFFLHSVPTNSMTTLKNKTPFQEIPFQ